MNIYFSFWQSGWRKSNLNMDMWRLSFELVKKHYGNKKLYLITDTQSMHLFKNYDFTEILPILDGIPDFQKVWCLGKIFAYKHAVSMGPFLHLDADVFLWEPLPESLLQSEVFCQSPDKPRLFEKGLKFSPYDIDHVKKEYGKVPQDWQTLLDTNYDIQAYNVGIFGGTNLKFISEYCDYVLEMVNDSQFYDLWRGINKGYSVHACLPCMLEQMNLTLFAEKKNIKINCLLDDFYDLKNKSYLKYSHLMLLKDKHYIMQRVSERVRKNPIDLEVKKVSIDEWNIHV